MDTPLTRCSRWTQWPVTGGGYPGNGGSGVGAVPWYPTVYTLRVLPQWSYSGLTVGLQCGFFMILTIFHDFDQEKCQKVQTVDQEKCQKVQTVDQNSGPIKWVIKKCNKFSNGSLKTGY